MIPAKGVWRMRTARHVTDAVVRTRRDADAAADRTAREALKNGWYIIAHPWKNRKLFRQSEMQSASSI
ncbi:MAG: hypothetical protein AAB572_00740 [Patescibacteria group bacterium]